MGDADIDIGFFPVLGLEGLVGQRRRWGGTHPAMERDIFLAVDEIGCATPHS